MIHFFRLPSTSWFLVENWYGIIMIRPRVQFENNLENWVFQRVFNLHMPVGRMHFETFWKNTPSAKYFRIEREKWYHD